MEGRVKTDKAVAVEELEEHFKMRYLVSLENIRYMSDVGNFQEAANDAIRAEELLTIASNVLGIDFVRRLREHVHAHPWTKPRALSVAKKTKLRK